MTASITFFPVGNGDMSLLEFDNGQKLLIDINVRANADDANEDEPDVMGMLRERLDRDDLGRLFVDGFLLSHPDKDHISGLEKHFHLGSPSTWSADDDKILINEMWSSPLIFRRADEADVCEGDPQAWWSEARRRVARFKDNGLATEAGERILILGEDVEGKSVGLESIMVTVGSEFSILDRVESASFSAALLGPLTAEDEDDAELLSKNDSSVVVRFSIRGGEDDKGCRFLTGGDAGVVVWERLEAEYGDTTLLDYDLLQTPHHCSWRSLSHDSYSEKGEDAEVSEDAKSALSHRSDDATIVASSRTISPDDADPPSDRAKREYVDILGDESRFLCVADQWEENDDPLIIVIDEAVWLSDKESNEPEEFKSAGLAASAAAIGISAAEQKARALSAASSMKTGGTFSKPYASD